MTILLIIKEFTGCLAVTAYDKRCRHFRPQLPLYCHEIGPKTAPGGCLDSECLCVEASGGPGYGLPIARRLARAGRCLSERNFVARDGLNSAPSAVQSSLCARLFAFYSPILGNMEKAALKPYRHTIRCDECREVIPASAPGKHKAASITVRCPLCNTEAIYAAYEVRAAVLSHRLGPVLVRSAEVA